MDIHTATEESYKNGYEKGYADGMAEAVKLGYAKSLGEAPDEKILKVLMMILNNTKVSSVNNDMFNMLYILHCELQCLLTENPNISKEIVDYWDKAVNEKIKCYGLDK